MGKGPQRPADSPPLCPWAAPASKLGMGIPSRVGTRAAREPRDVPHPRLELWVLAAGHRDPSGLGVGGRLSPLCLPVSHADLSHALASSEREIMVWPFRLQSPPRAGRHRSSSPGRGSAAPRYLLQAASASSAGTPPWRLRHRPPPAQPRGQQSPGCPSTRRLLNHCLREPLAARLLQGCSFADKAGPGSGSLGEGWRRLGLRNNRMLASSAGR